MPREFKTDADFISKIGSSAVDTGSGRTDTGHAVQWVSLEDEIVALESAKASGNWFGNLVKVHPRGGGSYHDGVNYNKVKRLSASLNAQSSATPHRPKLLLDWPPQKLALRSCCNRHGPINA